MLKWIECTGRTEEVAVQNALEQLGLDRDSVSVEILERARKGMFFGIGSTPAKVKVSYEVPDEKPAAPEKKQPEKKPVVKAEPKPEKKQPAKAEAKPEKKSAPKAEAKPEKKQPAPKAEAKSEKKPEKKPEKPAPAAAAFAEESQKPENPAPAAENSEDITEKVEAFLTGLLEQMGVKANVTISKKGENGIKVTLEGEKLGALIGHRGETLDAIQHLTNHVINLGHPHHVRVHIDAENYRAKREESLRRLADKVAAKVVKYRRNITLEPMNAYERHVIHETLQDYPDVITYSTGVEPNRRTVVAFSRGKHAY